MEEAKTQENTKLQTALHEMQQQFKETKDMLVKERESAKKAAEVVPVIKEVPVVNTELMDKLKVENEKLKVSLFLYLVDLFVLNCPFKLCFNLSLKSYNLREQLLFIRMHPCCVLLSVFSLSSLHILFFGNRLW